MIAQAQAASLRVGELAFDYAAPWQRADAAEEKGADGFILRRQDGEESLLVLLPQHQARLKLPEEDFFAQLRIRWQVLYGKTVGIDWVEAGGRRWLAARRPSMERPDAVVFHLVTVGNGMAHHVLVYAPASATVLPAAVTELLDGRGGAASSAPVAVAGAPEPVTEPAVEKAADAGPPPVLAEAAPTAPAGETVVVAAMPVGPRISPPVPVDEEPVSVPDRPSTPALPSEPAERWVLKRVVRVLPQGRTLDGLARAESEMLAGRAGLLTGYALERREHGMKGFVEGYRWVAGPDGRELRWPFLRHWEMAWKPPAEIWTGGEGLSVEVAFGPMASETDQTRQGLRAELALLCGSRRKMIATYDRMDRGEAAALNPFSAACLGEYVDLPSGEVYLTAEDRTAGQTVPIRRQIFLALPRRIGLEPPPGRGNVRRLVLTLRPLGSETGQAPGDALLAGLAVHYIYAPEEGPAKGGKR